LEIHESEERESIDSKDLKGEVAELGAHLITVKQLLYDHEKCFDDQTSSQDQITLIDERIEVFDDRVST
jgi:hypothetical protein